MGGNSSADLPNARPRGGSFTYSGKPRTAVRGGVPANGYQCLHQNAALQIERRDGVDVPNLERLERLEEPESLRRLREYVGARLPPVDLPEVILEVAQHTGFFSQFTHVSDSSVHVEDLPLSLSAVLLAEACNIGLRPVIKRCSNFLFWFARGARQQSGRPKA